VATPIHSIDPIVRVTLVALLNSLWGGIALTVLVGCLLRVVRRTNATTRYLIWWATLLAVVCLPPLAGHIPLTGSGGVNSANYIKPSVTPGPGTSNNPEVIVPPSAQAAGTSKSLKGSVMGSDPPKGREVRQRQSPGGVIVSQNHPSSTLSDSLFQLPPVFLQSAIRNLQSTIPPRLPFEFLPGQWQWALLLFAVWALSALGRVVRVVWGCLYLQRLKRESEPLAPQHQSRLNQWLMTLHTSRSVSLRASSEIRVPVTLGLINAVILFPKNMADRLSEAEVDQVGLHESAHIRRWDDWTNLGQKLIEAVFFFHPAVLWIGRQLDLEREIACDDWVVSLTGQPRPYAACLTKLVELTVLPRRPVLAPGAVMVRKHLSRRIEMLLNKKRDTTVRLCKLGFLISLGTLIGGVLQFSRLSPLIGFAEPRNSTAQSGQVKAPVVTQPLEKQQAAAGQQKRKAETAELQGEQRRALGKGLEQAEAELRNKADEGQRTLDE
jgi:beta-lactamase regulating signal transducer with metallopeptidase domain